MIYGKEFDQLIREKARIKRSRIGIGIKSPDQVIIDSLAKAHEFCDVVIYGHVINSMESYKTSEPEKAMIRAIQTGKLDAIVRGQSNAIIMRKAISKDYSLKLSDIKDLAILQDNLNRVFMMVPVSTFQGWSVKDKIDLIKIAAARLYRFNLPVKIGIISGSRPDTLGIRKAIDKTYADAEKIVKILPDSFHIKHYCIDIEKAIADGVTILVSPNGLVGNQMLRSMVFLGKIKIYGGIVAGIDPTIVESFRSSSGFYDYIEFTAALTNLRQQ